MIRVPSGPSSSPSPSPRPVTAPASLTPSNADHGTKNGKKRQWKYNQSRQTPSRAERALGPKSVVPKLALAEMIPATPLVTYRPSTSSRPRAVSDPSAYSRSTINGSDTPTVNNSKSVMIRDSSVRPKTVPAQLNRPRDSRALTHGTPRPPVGITPRQQRARSAAQILARATPASLSASVQRVPESVTRPGSRGEGVLDHWPCGTSYNGSSLAAVNSVSVVKPVYLTGLEDFMATELAAVKAGVEGPCPRRVQVMGQVWDRMIRDFPTYGPLMSVIKTEYDLMLRQLTERIQALGPLAAVLASDRAASEQQAKATVAAQIENAEELEKNLAETEKALFDTQMALKDRESDFQALKVELERERSRSRDMTDARRLLLSELEEQQNRVETAENERKADGAKLLELRGVLYDTQADLNTSLDELHQLRVATENVVPRSEAERLETELRTARMMLDNTKRMYGTVVTQYHNTLTHRDNLEKANAELEERLEEFCKTHTPRPEWDKVLPEEDRGIEKPSQPTEAVLSEVVSRLKKVRAEAEEYRAVFPEQFAEVARAEAEERAEARNSHDGPPYFIGLGTSADVPKWLRLSGKIRNRHLAKRDTEVFIREIWKSKRQFEARTGKRETLGEWMYTFLHKKYGIQAVIADWGYNLVDAIKRYSWDADCEIFLKVLNGELHEDVYVAQVEFMERLTKLCGRIDVASNGRSTGKISKRDLFASLAVFMPNKSVGQMDRLKIVLNQEQAGLCVEYKKLFEEDRELNQGPFVEELRDQYIEERQSYVEELEVAISAVAIDGMVSVKSMQEVFAKLDPVKPPSQVEAYIARGFGVPGSQLDLKAEIQLDPFLKRLKHGLLQRTTRVNPDGTLDLSTPPESEFRPVVSEKLVDAEAIRRNVHGLLRAPSKQRLQIPVPTSSVGAAAPTEDSPGSGSAIASPGTVVVDDASKDATSPLAAPPQSPKPRRRARRRVASSSPRARRSA